MSFEVRVDHNKLDVRLGKIEPQTLATLHTTIDRLDAELVDAARALAPDRTGKYKASIQGSVRATKHAIAGRVYSNSPLAVIIESGARIPPHEILPDAAEALHFEGGAGAVFAARVQSPGAVLPGQHIIGGAFDSMKDDIRLEIESAGRDAVHSV